MDVKEVTEMGSVGAIGAGGLIIPNLHETSEFFSGITPIVSFFLIVIPTGIWAWFRAIHYIKHKYIDKD